jgi:hypothetical protein
MLYRPALLATAACIIATPASAACVGKFARMEKYAGVPADKLLSNPVVHSRIRSLLGAMTRRFEESLEVSGTVELIGCALVVDGNARHQGGERNGIMYFDLRKGEMTAGFLDRDHVVIFTAEQAAVDPIHYDYLPARVRDWAFMASARFKARGVPPTGVTVQLPRTR